MHAQPIGPFLLPGLNVRQVTELPSDSFEPAGLAIPDETVAGPGFRRHPGRDLGFTSPSLEFSASIFSSREAGQMRLAANVPSPP
eukprot:12215453-Heterocapsa_arctica.AAC.1